MFKKINIKTLIIIFAVLTALVVLNFMVQNKKGDRNFKQFVAKIDTSAVTGIEISPKGDKESFKLIKEDGNWKVAIKESNFNADNRVIESLLKELNELKPERIAGKSDKKWDKFEVNDSLGSKLRVFEGSELTADLVVGKFSYKQLGGQMQMMQGGQGGYKVTTYLRDAGEETVYAIDGMLSMTVNRDANSFRNRMLLQTQKDNITQMAFSYPDSSFTLSKETGTWTINGLQVDSMEVDKYLNSIAYLSGNTFSDEASTGNALYKVSVQGNNMSPVEIAAFPADSTNNFIISSSDNTGTYFTDPNLTITNKLFVSKSKFE